MEQQQQQQQANNGKDQFLFFFQSSQASNFTTRIASICWLFILRQTSLRFVGSLGTWRLGAHLVRPQILQPQFLAPESPSHSAEEFQHHHLDKIFNKNMPKIKELYSLNPFSPPHTLIAEILICIFSCSKIWLKRRTPAPWQWTYNQVTLLKWVDPRGRIPKSWFMQE